MAKTALRYPTIRPSGSAQRRRREVADAAPRDEGERRADAGPVALGGLTDRGCSVGIAEQVEADDRLDRGLGSDGPDDGEVGGAAGGGTYVPPSAISWIWCRGGPRRPTDRHRRRAGRGRRRGSPSRRADHGEGGEAGVGDLVVIGDQRVRAAQAIEVDARRTGDRGGDLVRRQRCRAGGPGWLRGTRSLRRRRAPARRRARARRRGPGRRLATASWWTSRPRHRGVQYLCVVEGCEVVEHQRGGVAAWQRGGRAGQGRAVVDIDGVVADARHRLHHIAGGHRDWERFFAAAGDDPPHPEGLALVATLAADHDVVFLTGRPGRYRSMTERWLADHGLGGHRSDHA